jgi:hypothetical protein
MTETPAARAIRLINQLTHTKGPFAQQSFNLRPWQARILKQLFTTGRDGRRRYRQCLLMLPRKNGKALALDTELPTPDGYRRMGDLSVGDRVFGPDGLPTTVTVATPPMADHACFRMTFSDGTVIVADAEHKWSVFDIWRERTIILTTDEIAATFRVGHRPRHREHRYRVPVAAPLDYPAKAFDVDPYVLGVWLGDGHSASCYVTTADEEIVESLVACGETARVVPSSVGQSAAATYAIGTAPERNRDKAATLQARLRAIGVLHDKHIPSEYLCGSIEQRMALLQGLMDTDGSVAFSGPRRVPRCEYGTTVQRLADDVFALVASLGMKPTIIQTQATIKGKDCGPVFRICFTAYADRPVFKLARKRQRLAERPPRATRSVNRSIVDVMPVESVQVRCIKVARPDGLFLVGRSCVTTHNTELAAALAIYFLLFDGEIGGEVYSAAADKDQAALVFNVAAQMIRNDPELLAQCEIIDSQKRIVHRRSGSFYRAISAEAYCVAPYTAIELQDGRRLPAIDVRAGDVVIGWNGNELAPGIVRSVRLQPSSPILGIRTSRGRSISVTPEHQFLAMTPGRRPFDQTHEYHWLPARELTVGTRIRVALGNPYRATSCLSVRDAWALGAWAGDGECGRFRFTNVDDEIVKRLRSHLEGVGSTLVSTLSTRQLQHGAVATLDYPQEHQIIGVGRRRQSPGREWVREHFGQHSRAHTKRIPAAIWTSDASAWCAFLAGWLDTDGCIPTTAKQVTWCSVSHELLRDGQALLARLGINACVNQSNGLTVNGRAQLARLSDLLTPHMALTRKLEKLLARAAEPRAMGYFAHDSDIITAIEPDGDEFSVSLDVDAIDTHVTDGLVTHNSKHGFNASVVIYDELHAAPNRELWDVLTTSQGARSQPLTLAISTAGYDRHSILWELYAHAKKVLEQPSLDPTFLPILFEAPIDADWTDERVWKKANPALGDFRSLEEMRQAAARAKEIPAQENTFRRLYLNQWTEQAARWISMPAWDACCVVAA